MEDQADCVSGSTSKKELITMALFHYTRLNTFLELILREKTLRTSNLNVMNDPRVARKWAFGGTNVPLESLFPDFYNDDSHIECQYRFGQMIKDRFQVICFSGAKRSGWNNEMMWAHYADNQRGVCLEFDEEILLDAVKSKYPACLTYLENVNYLKVQKESPWIEWNLMETTEVNLDNILQNIYSRMVFHKSHFWEKEDERRLLILNPEPLYIPIAKALKAIHFGIGCHPGYVHAVDYMIKDLDVKLYTMIYQNDEYARWRLTKDGDRFSTSIDS